MRRGAKDFQRVSLITSYEWLLRNLSSRSKQTVLNLTKSSIYQVNSLFATDRIEYDDAMRARFWLFVLRVGRAISEPEEE